MIQEIGARNFLLDICNQNIFGRGEPLCHNSIDCCFVSGSKRYNLVSSMVTNRERQEFIWIATKNFQMLLRRLAPLNFDRRLGVLGPTSRSVSVCLNLLERWIQPAHVRCSVLHLLI